MISVSTTCACPLKPPCDENPPTCNENPPICNDNPHENCCVCIHLFRLFNNIYLFVAFIIQFSFILTSIG